MTGFRHNHFHVLIKRFGYNFHYDFFLGVQIVVMGFDMVLGTTGKITYVFFMVLNIAFYGC